MKKKDRKILIGAGIGLALLWWLSNQQKTVIAPPKTPVKPSPTAPPSTAMPAAPAATSSAVGRYHTTV